MFIADTKPQHWHAEGKPIKRCAGTSVPRELSEGMTTMHMDYRDCTRVDCGKIFDITHSVNGQRFYIGRIGRLDDDHYVSWSGGEGRFFATVTHYSPFTSPGSRRFLTIAEARAWLEGVADAQSSEFVIDPRAWASKRDQELTIDVA